MKLPLTWLSGVLGCCTVRDAVGKEIWMESRHIEELVSYANMLDRIRDLVFSSPANSSDVLDEIEAILKGQEK